MIVVLFVVLLLSRSFMTPTGDNIYEEVKVKPGYEKTLAGLRKVKTKAKHPCAGSFEVIGKVDAYGKKMCTTTNETLTDNPIPEAKAKKLQDRADNMQPLKSSETIKSIKDTGSLPLDPEIAKEYQSTRSASASIAEQNASPQLPTTPGCYGSGKDGRRIVVIASGTHEQPITSFDIARIKNVVGQMESTLIWNSYLQNPDKVMHWRFYQGGNCEPEIITATQDANYYNELSVATFSQLKQDWGIIGAANTAKQQAVGENLLPHFLVFTRSGANACGQSDFNWGGVTNDQETFSFVYGMTPSGNTGSQCWNGWIAQHEIMHSMGAVDITAPHATVGAHCTDEWDIMCYDDGAGVVINCPTVNGSTVLADYVMDCNADDYFSVKPDADSVFNPPPWWLGGTTLTRYNTAKSGFMIDRLPITYSIGLEPEQASDKTGVTSPNDATASGSSYVQFGTGQ